MLIWSNARVTEDSPSLVAKQTAASIDDHPTPRIPPLPAKNSKQYNVSSRSLNLKAHYTCRSSATIGTSLSAVIPSKTQTLKCIVIYLLCY